MVASKTVSWQLRATAFAAVLMAGMAFAGQSAQAGDKGTLEQIAASPASNALATHCSGRTRGVFQTQLGWLEFLQTQARALTGRTFQADLVSCAQNLVSLGNDGFAGINVLIGVCAELRGGNTCKTVRGERNRFITHS